MLEQILNEDKFGPKLTLGMINKWIKEVMNLHSQLDSCACDNSPLSSAEKEKLEKVFKTLNRVNIQIAKRLNKKNK